MAASCLGFCLALVVTVDSADSYSDLELFLKIIEGRICWFNVSLHIQCIM